MKRTDRLLTFWIIAGRDQNTLEDAEELPKISMGIQVLIQVSSLRVHSAYCTSKTRAFKLLKIIKIRALEQ